MDNCNSIKGLFYLPFKGKGEIRQIRNEAEQELDSLRESRNALVEEFQAEFKRSLRSLPIRLALHRYTDRRTTQHYTYLYWFIRHSLRKEMPGLPLRIQKLSDPVATKLLSTLPQHVQSRMLDYDNKARSLESSISMASCVVRALNDRIQDIEAWSAVSHS